MEQKHSKTIRWALFGTTAVVAALIRLTELGSTPLSPSEAEAAWAVWRFWQVGAETLPIHSPAYFTLTAVVTQILGYSDGIMRLVPALFGIGTVLLPWLLRHKLGLVGTFVTSLLLAISPSQAIASRLVGGDSIALFTLLLTLIATIRLNQSNDQRWLYPLFGAIGLGLASSPLFYSGLIILLITSGRRILQALKVSNRAWNKAGAFGFAIFLASSSLFLWYLPGIGAVSTVLADWLAQFNVGQGIQATLDPFLALVRYESWLIFLTIFSIIFVLTEQEKDFGHICISWIGAVIILLLIQQGVISNILLLTLPGYLLVGIITHAVLDVPIQRYGWVAAGVMLALLTITFVNLARYTRVTLNDGADISLWMGLLSLIVLIFVVYFVATWDATAVAQALMLALIGFVIFYQAGTAWWVSHQAANDPRERWVTEATDDSIHTIHRLLTDISRETNNSESNLTITSGVNSPVLSWYLRDFTRLTMSDGLPVNTQSPVLISMDDTVLPGSDYVGADFPLIRTQSSVPQETLFVDILRWWLLRESTAVYERQPIIIWWRTDLKG